MSRKNWTKIGALLGFLAIIVTLIFGVVSYAGTDEALRYFGISLVLFFSMFVYFEFLKEYPTSHSRRGKTE